MATTVGLTGASGFIGGTIAHDLRQAGYSVQALVRSPDQAKKLKELEIQPILGELENPHPAGICNKLSVRHSLCRDDSRQ